MRIIVIAFCLTLTSLSYAGDEATAAKSFESLTLTRCWELGMWRVNNCKEHDEHSENFKLSMTAQAFRYWLLVKKELIAPNLAHEAQIKKAFERGELSMNTLKNPLSKNSQYQGGFGIGEVSMSAEEYAASSIEFETFVKSKAATEDQKTENKSQMATPSKPSD